MPRRPLFVAVLLAVAAMAPATAQAPALHAVINCGSLQVVGKVHIHVERVYLGTVLLECGGAQQVPT